MRITPYRTQGNRIDVLVISYTDITASKQVEATLRGTAAGDECWFCVVSDAWFSSFWRS